MRPPLLFLPPHYNLLAPQTVTCWNLLPLLRVLWEEGAFPFGLQFGMLGALLHLCLGHSLEVMTVVITHFPSLGLSLLIYKIRA